MICDILSDQTYDIKSPQTLSALSRSSVPILHCAKPGAAALPSHDYPLIVNIIVINTVIPISIAHPS